jgi:predicted transcriptional regulator
VVVVYASGETKALLGAFQIARIVSAKPNTIWRRFRESTGLTKREFDEYFAGAEKAHAIEIAHTWRLRVPVCLPMLRKRQRGFRPPQGYHYLDFGTLSDIGGEALLRGRRVAQQSGRRLSRGLRAASKPDRNSANSTGIAS